MKTILVPTDFSEPAKNAASYAINLAQNIKAGLILCHAIKIPSETPMAAQVAWPLEDYTSLKADADKELEQLSVTLQKENPYAKAGAGRSLITKYCDVGEVIDVVTGKIDEDKSVIVVMGMSGAGAMSRFFLGSNTQDMISDAAFPVLLIPSQAKYHPVTKIAFATDLNNSDIEMIHSVASLARYFNAELLIAHVTDEKYETGDEKQEVEAFLNEVTCKANYPKIYYRHIKGTGIMRGLDWLSEHGVIDMLVMVHRKVNPLERLFGISYTEKLSHHTEIPLLVLPEGLPPLHF